MPQLGKSRSAKPTGTRRSPPLSSWSGIRRTFCWHISFVVASSASEVSSIFPFSAREETSLHYFHVSLCVLILVIRAKYHTKIPIKPSNNVNNG